MARVATDMLLGQGKGFKKRRFLVLVLVQELKSYCSLLA